MFAGHCLGYFTLVQYVEPAVNRQPSFRRELVEQVSVFIILVLYFLSLRAIQKNKMSSNFKLIRFFIFSEREGPVQNQCLLELRSSYSQNLKIQYILKTLNATELVTQMQSIS